MFDPTRSCITSETKIYRHKSVCATNDSVLIRNAPQLVEHFPGFSCRDMKLEVVHIHLLLLVRSTTSFVTIRKCCQLGETLDEWYKCQRPDNERWVQGEQFVGSFVNFHSVCIFRWTSQCAEKVFHDFLEKTLPGNLVQPAIEKQQVVCPTRNKREVHLFDTAGFVCEEEEGSGLNANGGPVTTCSNILKEIAYTVSVKAMEPDGIISRSAYLKVDKITAEIVT